MGDIADPDRIRELLKELSYAHTQAGLSSSYPELDTVNFMLWLENKRFVEFGSNNCGVCEDYEFESDTVVTSHFEHVHPEIYAAFVLGGRRPV
jgi:hypothetical protein